MKKITFILIALITGSAMAQDGAQANATATVNAEIVSPISIESTSNLDFGRIIGNDAGGDVKIATDGTRTSDNNDLLDPTEEGNQADFEITAAEGYSYSISAPATQLTGDGEAMDVTFESSLGNSAEGTGNTQNLGLGGILTVNPSQAEGDYTGEVSVTVSYE